MSRSMSVASDQNCTWVLTQFFGNTAINRNPTAIGLIVGIFVQVTTNIIHLVHYVHVEITYTKNLNTRPVDNTMRQHPSSAFDISQWLQPQQCQSTCK